jgi:hypothetical protein
VAATPATVVQLCSPGCRRQLNTDHRAATES